MNHRALKLLMLLIFTQSVHGQDYHIHFTNNCPHSQKQANNWYFGFYAGLSFNSGQVVALTNNTSIQLLEGNACISDSNGTFLLSTGMGSQSKLSLFNSQFQVLPGGNELEGYVSSTQSSLIIPHPGYENLYFVFSIDIPAVIHKFGLTYSVVDISGNNGSGLVVIKNDTLLPKVSEKISATKHKNGNDVWIVTHMWNNNTFCAFLIDDNGLNPVPVTSHVGSIHTNVGNDINQGIGQMKISPEGNKLALSIFGSSKYEIFDFDNETGLVSNVNSSLPIYTGAYGVEFSADTRFLYCSTADLSPGNTGFHSRIFQFDILKNNEIFNFGSLLAVDSSGSYFCGLQLAPDGKIYIARALNGSDYLGVIHNPTRPGLECNFNLIDNVNNQGLYLEGKKNQYGLPNFMQSYFLIPKFLYQPNCLGEETLFEMVNTTNVDSVSWDFGDGSPGSTVFAPTHTFNAPGNYTVKLTDYFNGKGYPDSLLININPLPPVEINGGKDTVILLPSSSVILDAGSGYQTYLWSNGSEEPTIEVFEEGYNWVEVSDFNCCYKADTIFVELFYLIIPNAFLPAGTGQDKFFQILDPNGSVSDFSIVIYNRLGQQVFKSDDINFTWNGEGCVTGVYYYTLKAVLTNGYPYQFNGNITLIR